MSELEISGVIILVAIGLTMGWWLLIRLIIKYF